MKLLERYSTFAGLKIGKQQLLENFYPLPFEKYITLHASSGMGSKNYPYFSEVVSIIQPILLSHGIQIVQIGTKDEPHVHGTHSLLGMTTIHQANYLVGKALAHVGNDSIWAHRAGHLGIPLVCLYGPTSAANHGPTDYHSVKTILIESHRWGRNPSFQHHEPNPTIALIDPFDIARAILSVLDIGADVSYKTCFISQSYNITMLDCVPNTPVAANFNPGLPLVVRMDLEHNEPNLIQILATERKIHLICNKPIELSIFQNFQNSFISVNYEIDDTTPVEYAKALKKACPKTIFFTRNLEQNWLSALKFKFFDIVNIEQFPFKTKQDFLNEAKKFLPHDSKTLDKLDKDSKLFFKTNKYVLSNGKIYLSHAHRLGDEPVKNGNSGEVIDSPEFWHDLNQYMIFTKNDTNRK